MQQHICDWLAVGLSQTSQSTHLPSGGGHPLRLGDLAPRHSPVSLRSVIGDAAVLDDGLCCPGLAVVLCLVPC